MAGFSVDTKLFRELGELLVGRDSTALTELIKNAYDADSTLVQIFAERLREPDHGVIVIDDDGVGMNIDEFSRGFLRIAGRSKIEGDRRSPYFRRRFTGEKGIGRLAAHKLARLLEVVSSHWSGADRDPDEGFPSIDGVDARIDWDMIEALETLDQVESSEAIRVQGFSSHQRAGTKLTLRRLRRRWTDRDFDRFFNEIATLTPPQPLTAPLENGIVPRPLLFSTPRLRDEGRDSDFEIRFGGELALQESDVAAVAESAYWVIEIDCAADTRKVRVAVEPTSRGRAEYPTAEGFHFDQVMRSDQPLVSFQARILQQEYGAWPNAYRGVRVYYEGFRVLPYGDPRDDWLDLDRDYRSRGRTELARLRRFAEWDFPPGDERESLSVQGNGAFFGGVFFTRNGARELQMLVNREGFLPNPAFDGVADLVRLGIDLQVRLRYATTSEIKQARKSDSERQKQAASQGGRQDAPSGFLVASLQQDALTTIREARTALAAGRGGDAAQKLDLIEERLTSANAIVKEAVSEVTMYRILASIGLEHAAFVHEVNSLALTAQSIAAVLEGLAHEAQGTLRQRLRQLVAEIHDLRERLRRNAVYLADMTGVEGRRRRSRQRLRSAIEKITAFFARSIAERGLTILNEVPEKAETPPMFPAEVYAIVSNLLSNAVKFSGRGGRIRASVRDEPGALVFRLENTGARINLRGAERWFEPFRSTTTEIDESLGQGMGLGLTITRSLVDEYGGIIQFVSPSKSYNTAVEVTLPRR